MGIDPETQNEVPLFNPRTQIWSEHFQFSDGYSLILGLTPIGRATVSRLKINREYVVRARKRWQVIGWEPPLD